MRAFSFIKTVKDVQLLSEFNVSKENVFIIIAGLLCVKIFIFNVFIHKFLLEFF